jgi:NAD(P)-dependent dehydrogenase (short-subunit alcohol dehydrogenase family)
MRATGRTILVTGATSGLGRATATALALRGGNVTLLARDQGRGETVVDSIRSRGGDAELLLCDLSSLDSVRTAAAHFRERHPLLHGLVHCAAVFIPRRTVTAEGLETMFVTNHLGPFLLTRLLREPLQRAAPSRVVVVSAPSTTRLDFNDLQGERNFGPLSAFGATKTANLLFAYALARRLEGTGTTVNAVHPGIFRSDLMRQAPALIRWVSQFRAVPAEQAAEHVLRPLLDPELAQLNGRFFRLSKQARPTPYTMAPATQERLWETSERLVEA